ncbi:M20/M25/M40 family metallo-hydrolase [Gluconacetobacter aggeris]|uniref:M20/M25/M40 family metallo-hydrolase n=2 Tax=Gluconacetobacter aggeris TaxID=1286186 RepID=A0A7W4IRU9_9PROT|nr:M20/M25/M40 family metallo-hydrolase [Gluconacetobacter aggeris]
MFLSENGDGLISSKIDAASPPCVFRLGRKHAFLGSALGVALAFGVAGQAWSASFGDRQAVAASLALAEKAIALRSVAGPGNQTPQVAQLFRDALIAGGFATSDIVITPAEGTAYLIARWPGSDPSLKPLVISGHMDVVEAKAEDWTHDPFKAKIEKGFLLGRGATDMKLDDAIAIEALVQLKRAGYKPRRAIVIEFSGDEETTMATGAIIADKLSGAEMVLNVDGANGVIDEKTGKPDYFAWEGGEKTYADYQLVVTNPGGHSSEPRPLNAIDEMAEDLLRIQHYRFRPELNELSRGYFLGAAQWESAPIGAAMRAFAAEPTNEDAIETLSADPSFVGRIGTTCVVTEINGGHALNALPQRVTANVNCRIFPGHPRADILNELRQAAADPGMTITDVTAGSVETPASPMRADVVRAIEHAVHGVYPNVAVFPALGSGASDSMWFRSRGVPSYAVSPLFIRNSDSFMHGLNERTPIASVGPAIDIVATLVTDLSR